MASLAEDMGPYDAIEYVARHIGESVTKITKNLPLDTEPKETALEKWAIIEVELRAIKEMVKEGIKAREIGSEAAATVLERRQEHTPLDTY